MACDKDPWNTPYPNEDKNANILYTAFTEHPQHLDPAESYSETEWVFLGEIYEPPLQYNYLKRPYTLEPLTASRLPTVQYFNQKGELINENAPSTAIAYSEYTIHIKPGIYYYPHPAFAKENESVGARELVAEDYVYQIKRMALPTLSSPVFGLLSHYIVGLSELREQLKNQVEIDLKNIQLSGVKSLDRYTYRIRVRGKYPQLQFWLATPFFAPMPWEAIQFYATPGLKEKNISLNWFPVGTGPYYLSENNPERRMVLEKNPLYRQDEKLSRVDKILFSLERENIPYWLKFLQGYYDSSGVSSDNFSSVIKVNDQGKQELTPTLKKQGITLETAVSPGIWYWGFNFLDPIVGGNSPRAKKLREAISLAFDLEEYISIFLNGRGVVATGPIPSDIIGNSVQATRARMNVEKARLLLKEGGWAGLTLYFDTEANGSPDEIATQAWLKKQFEKIGINLVIRGTTFNRFLEKLRNGSAQLFFYGWSADYPDPENFLFLFYGPNKSVLDNGPNVSNYQNSDYDRLYEKIRAMDNGPARLALIREMDAILKMDNIWIGGFYPISYSLQHQWMSPRKPSGMIINTLKYVKIDPKLRSQQQWLWNKPYRWPLWLLGLVVLGGIYQGIRWYHQKQHRSLERAK